jgi:hypothetical protein
VEGEIMKKYEVDFTDATTGAESPIDTITVSDDYTPDDYIKDCAGNGVDWGNGEITFVEIEE